MCAALMRLHAVQAGTSVEVHSAGTQPGDTLNQLAAEVIAEVGADMSAETPRPIDPALLRRVDRVVVLGNEARVDPAEPMVGTIDTWATDEPSERGIERSEEHTSELQSRFDLVCRLLLEKKKYTTRRSS